MSLELIGSPTFILSSIGSVIVFIGYLYYTQFESKDSKVDTVSIFLFNRTKQLERLKAKTFDGFVSYGKGGFLESPYMTVDYRHGRVRKTGQDPLKRKRRRTSYVARMGTVTPLDLSQPDNRPDSFDIGYYDNLRKTTRERSVNEGKMIATKQDFMGVILTVAAGASALLAGAAWLFVTIAPSIA